MKPFSEVIKSISLLAHESPFLYVMTLSILSIDLLAWATIIQIDQSITHCCICILSISITCIFAVCLTGFLGQYILIKHNKTIIKTNHFGKRYDS